MQDEGDRVLNFEQMKELLELVARLGVGGAEVRSGDFSFRVTGATSAATFLPPSEADTQRAAGEAVASTAALDAAKPAAPAPEAAATKDESADEEQGHILTSPIVGTFYRAPSPEAEDYVKPGDRVEKGQVLCIVEAMKLMNEIESELSGVILEVLPENAQPVEFGEPLFSIKTD